MIFKTESGRVGYRKKYRVAGRVRVPVGHWQQLVKTTPTIWWLMGGSCTAGKTNLVELVQLQVAIWAFKAASTPLLVHLNIVILIVFG